MTESVIISKIQARIDELEPFSDTDLNPSISVIESILNDSARAFLLSIPASIVTPTDFSGSTVHILNTDGVGKVELPEDYLKMHSFKLELWSREITEFITPSSPKYKLQFNRVTRGGMEKPVCVIKTDPTPGAIRYMYYYSIDDDHLGSTPIIETALYIPIQAATKIEDNLIIPFVWYCAAEVLQVMGEAALEEKARAKVQEYILSQTI